MVKKEDILYALRRLESYINDMDDDDFDDFSGGCSPVCSSFIPFEWRLPMIGGTYVHRLTHLEVKVK